jgi:elongation factor Ts
MAITATQVNELRQRTGVSMMQCKKALEQSQGNEEKAIEILRKQGAAKAAEKADRAMKQGVVVAREKAGKAVLAKLLCETDFVAKNSDFIAFAERAADEALKKGADATVKEMEAPLKELFTKLGENMALEIKILEGKGIGTYIHTNSKIGVLVDLKTPDSEKARDIAMHIAAMGPKHVSPDQVPAAEVDKEKEIWRELLKKEGKPEAMFDKIMFGKEKKFREESALLKQSFVKNGEMTVEQYLGTNTVTQFIRLTI